MWALIKRWIPALRSRKTRVAVTTTIVTLVARFGFDVDPEIIYSIVALGTAIILGIAHEDNGKHRKTTIQAVPIKLPGIGKNGSAGPLNP